MQAGFNGGVNTLFMAGFKRASSGCINGSPPESVIPPPLRV
jgi:hypothetical protein